MEYERCSCHHEENQNAILYTLLSQNLSHHRGSHSPSQKRCLCQKRRTVCLQTPQATCQAASDVLVKTISFMKNLPSFQLLPWKDQLLLLDSCWAPLFLLGLVQEMVTFEVMETPAPSMLERILLDGPCKRQELQRAQPTLASVQRLQCSLNSFWSLDLSPKEYAYLKGAILFNPDVPGLKASSYIESLQREAQRALQEVMTFLHPEDQGRFAHVLLISSSLKSIPPALLTALFFQPVIGNADILELLTEMMLARELPWPQ
ncbi:nuclear receptor subfamily 0 group B member 2 [Podarcis raffonei]|uniref:Nuclear receptor subfamily 0 group B member 2 n=2 Tax=Podarcis TaxID=42163 RepID=A0A670IPC3_PODMU|nr:nuclear receptor subfamily 0 group B member 2 [Podarcis muralis]XP_053254647.1 nuclear receptor subfamily 0 group B member 2 [Podarcis raffonei]CAI5781553.1 nuclear receptor subfamily 0 group B member 2 [Podarcis lilfordi]